MRSNHEKLFSIELNALSIDWKYEPFQILVLPSVETPTGTLSSSYYTPDFYFEYEGYKVYIEVKGYLRHMDHFKYKVIKHYFSNYKNKIFLMVKWSRSDQKFYLYSLRNKVKLYKDWFNCLKYIIKTKKAPNESLTIFKKEA